MRIRIKQSISAPRSSQLSLVSTAQWASGKLVQYLVKANQFQWKFEEHVYCAIHWIQGSLNLRIVTVYTAKHRTNDSIFDYRDGEIALLRWSKSFQILQNNNVQWRSFSGTVFTVSGWKAKFLSKCPSEPARRRQRRRDYINMFY